MYGLVIDGQIKQVTNTLEPLLDSMKKLEWVEIPEYVYPGFAIKDGDFIAPIDQWHHWNNENKEWEITEENNEERIEFYSKEAREKRNDLIKKTDHFLMTDYKIKEEMLKKVKDYRQALRDVPQQLGFPLEIDWPVLTI